MHFDGPVQIVGEALFHVNLKNQIWYIIGKSAIHAWITRRNSSKSRLYAYHKILSLCTSIFKYIGDPRSLYNST